MKKKILLSLIVLAIVILALTSFEKNKLNTSMTGMYVDDFLIQNNKTIPSTVIEESIPMKLDIDVRRVFSSYEISGVISINNVNYKIASSTQSDEKLIAALSPQSDDYSINAISGTLYISKDLKHISIRTDHYHLVAPANSKEEAIELVNIMYGAE